MGSSVLIVDDERSTCEALALSLRSRDVSSYTATSAREAIERMDFDGNAIGVIVVDFHLPDMRGDELVQKLREKSSDAFIYIYSGDDGQNTIKNSLRSGANDFFDKNDDVIGFIELIVEKINVFNGLHKTKSPYEEGIRSVGLAGRSQKLAKVIKDIRKFSSFEFPILILGETGTGKECLARLAHGNSNEKYLALNCAAYSTDSNLLEAELFGYEEGSFTGANKTKVGLFEAAGKGTVFLDEIHELSHSSQSKLLRVIQEKKIRRVGGVDELPIQANIVAAAKPNIRMLIEDGQFLLDLYNRLSALEVEIPPLRERPEDIEPMIEFFLKKYNKKFKKNARFTRSSIEQLTGQSWPGNVRELENFVLRSIIDSQGDVISMPRGVVSERAIGTLTHLKKQHMNEEKKLIVSALDENHGKLRPTARQLAVPTSSLVQKMKKYNIESGRVGK